MMVFRHLAAVLPNHLLIEVDPHRLIRGITGRSSHALREEFPSLATRLPTLWTNSYFVFTAGGSPLAVVKQYIENQKPE
jgi:putative transposase